MVRLAGAVSLAMLPLPALAAATSEDFLFLALFGGPLAYLFASVPTAGVGYVLGSFLKPATSVLVLASLALIPVVVLWITRGFGQAAQFAPVPFGMLMLLSPLIYFGWRFGRRDAIVHAARDSVPANGS
jgi:uncharacterized membrane protein